MDISPIIISMKTATIAILFTFILGLLAARWILYRKSDATRIFWDGIFTMPLVLPPTVAGFILGSRLHFHGAQRSLRQL